jgi:predicted membrane-bound mannosyltransferase
MVIPSFFGMLANDAKSEILKKTKTKNHWVSLFTYLNKNPKERYFSRQMRQHVNLTLCTIDTVFWN